MCVGVLLALCPCTVWAALVLRLSDPLMEVMDPLCPAVCMRKSEDSSGVGAGASVGALVAELAYQLLSIFFSF